MKPLYFVDYREGCAGSFIISLIFLFLTDRKMLLGIGPNGFCHDLWENYKKTSYNYNFILCRGIIADQDFLNNDWKGVCITYEATDLFLIELLAFKKRFVHYPDDSPIFKYYLENKHLLSNDLSTFYGISESDLHTVLTAYIKDNPKTGFRAPDINYTISAPYPTVVRDRYRNFEKFLELVVPEDRHRIIEIKFSDIFNNSTKVIEQLSALTNCPVTDVIRKNYINYLEKQPFSGHE
jgi:hypothetical protein